MQRLFYHTRQCKLLLDNIVLSRALSAWMNKKIQASDQKWIWDTAFSKVTYLFASALEMMILAPRGIWDLTKRRNFAEQADGSNTRIAQTRRRLYAWCYMWRKASLEAAGVQMATYHWRFLKIIWCLSITHSPSLLCSVLQWQRNSRNASLHLKWQLIRDLTQTNVSTQDAISVDMSMWYQHS